MSAISNPLEDQIKRSTTPAASEKVLLFLEGIERAGGAISNPPSSIASHDDDDEEEEPVANPLKDNLIHVGNNVPSERGTRSPAASKRVFQGNSVSAFGDWQDMGGPGNGDDAHSIEQVGRRSNPPSENMYAENNPRTHEEPGPHYASFGSSFGNLNLNLDGPGPADGPGPRYESGTSSFGNFGPLPPDNVLPGPADILPGWHQQHRTPMFAARVPLPAESTTMSPRQFAQPTPMLAAGVPLPAESILMSPKSATKSAAKSSSYNIDIQPPTPPDSHTPGISKAGSAISRRSDKTEKNNGPPQPVIPVIPVIPALTDDFAEFRSAIHAPKSPLSRARSRPPTEKSPTVGPMSPQKEPDKSFSPRSNVDKNLFSPKSNASRALSGLSKPGTKAISHVGTNYPGLPASRAESMQYTSSDDAPSPPSKSFHQPSIAHSYGTNINIRHQQPTVQDTSSSTNSETNTDGPAANLPDTHTVPESSYFNRPTSPFVGSPLGRAISAAAQELDGLTADISAMRQAVTGTHSVAASVVQIPEQSNRPSSPQMTHASDPQSLVRSRVVSPTKSHAHAPPSVSHSRRDITDAYDQQETPTQSRPHSPDMTEEQQILSDLLNRKARTRTSYATTTLGADVEASHFHDQELCILLHAADDPMAHDVVRKVVKKAIRNRLKSLKMKHDPESIQTYKRNFHDHDPSWHEHNPPTSDEPPAWAKDIMMHLTIMEQRVAALGPKIESLRSPEGSRGARTHSHRARSRLNHLSESRENYTNGTPQSQPSHLRGQTTGDDSMYRPLDTEFTPPGESTTHGHTLPGSMHHHGGSEHPNIHEDEFEDENEMQGPNGQTFTNRTPPTQDSTISHHFGKDPLSTNRNESPGQQFLEEQLYRLRVRDPSQSQVTHQSWEIAREGAEDDRDDEVTRQTTIESELPEIAGSVHNGYDARRVSSPPLPPLPTEANQSRDIIENMIPGQQAQHTPWAPTDAWTQEPPAPPPWQRIHQRLLSWAIVWPMSELDSALNSTNRGFQIDEVALSIWSTQQYKRYVRNQLTEVPPGRVDRLFVPPNMADAINNAVLYGRHGDACGMLRDLWAPFGLEGMPRIIIVLCKHRTDANHWVAHKFSLPDGTLTTYDTYPEKSLPDGRPLGWWFAIRIAWPTAMYPSPDHLMQKMVRLHRPMQLAIDNSVAAAGIWRNLLMSSRAERPLDLERLRDLINTEVKNLRQRKEQGKLSISATRPKWEMAI